MSRPTSSQWAGGGKRCNLVDIWSLICSDLLTRVLCQPGREAGWDNMESRLETGGGGRGLQGSMAEQVFRENKY